MNQNKIKEDYEKYKKKRIEINKEIKKAKRNEILILLDHNNSKERFRYVQKLKGISNQVTKCGDLSVEDFNIYFITAFDTSDTVLTPHWNIQQTDQSQSIILRPFTDGEILQHSSTLKNKKSVVLESIALRWQY